MIDPQTIFEIHLLKKEGLSVQKIADRLKISWLTVNKYLQNPERKHKRCRRKSKLDLFKEEIKRMLEINSKASAVVIRQRLAEKGYNGGLTILKDYLCTIRKRKSPRAFVRFEAAPGEQFQIDWGHFGSLTYGNDKRKLYCFVMIEAHSRMLYLEFTHSQNQATLHRCLVNGFCFLNGTPKELVFDNMLTAVIERQGRLIRYNEAFLALLRHFDITPRPCNPGQPQEKGKVEKGGIHYVRHNFWPLRSFRDLDDVQSQGTYWRDHQANVRVHSTTGQRPVDRFKPEALRPLPDHLPDCREMLSVKVHTDFSVCFDTNRYTVPPGLVGKELTLKADHNQLTIYYKDKSVTRHTRCWQRRQRIELPSHREAARRELQQKHLSSESAAFISLGEDARIYLEKMADLGQPLKKNLSRLLLLKDEYGAGSLLMAIRRAISHNAYGADYIENILYQEMTPQRIHPPVRLKNKELNRIRLQEPSLAEYDAFIIKKRK